MSVAPRASTETAVHVSRGLPAPPEVVWRVMVQADAAEAWLGAEGFAPVVGQRCTLRLPPTPGFDGIVQAEVVEVEAPRRLRLAWSTRGGGELTVRLAIDGEGTRVEVVQAAAVPQHAEPVAQVWRERLRGPLMTAVVRAAGVGAAVGTVAGGALALGWMGWLGAIVGLAAMLLVVGGALMLGTPWLLAPPTSPPGPNAAPEPSRSSPVRASERSGSRPNGRTREAPEGPVIPAPRGTELVATVAGPGAGQVADFLPRIALGTGPRGVVATPVPRGCAPLTGFALGPDAALAQVCSPPRVHPYTRLALSRPDRTSGAPPTSWDWLTSTVRLPDRSDRGPRHLGAPVWHPQGLVVFEGSSRPGVPVRLYFARPGRTLAAEMFSPSRVEGDLEAPALSADPGRLVFRASTSEGTDLWVWERGQDTRHRLTHTPDLREGPPTLSPDGERVAFVERRLQRDLLHLVTVPEGRRTVTVTPVHGTLVRPTWVSEQHLAVFRHDGADTDLVVLRDGKLVARLGAAVLPGHAGLQSDVPGWMLWAHPSGSLRLSHVDDAHRLFEIPVDDALRDVADPALFTADGRTWVAFTAVVDAPAAVADAPPVAHPEGPARVAFIAPITLPAR